jgi:hypothetical protein
MYSPELLEADIQDELAKVERLVEGFRGLRHLYRRSYSFELDLGQKAPGGADHPAWCVTLRQAHPTHPHPTNHHCPMARQGALGAVETVKVSVDRPLIGAHRRMGKA